MKTIINFCKRVLGAAQNFVKKVLAVIASVIKRGTFALPHDDVERLEAQRFLYKTLTIVLALAVLCTGVWLADHDYPSWTALCLFALRLLYALPANRVERALRQHQYQDRERIRARYSDPGHRRAKSV